MYVLVTGSMEIMHVDTEPQANRHDENTVGLKNDGGLVATCHQSLAGRLNRVEVEDGGGILNTPPPPEHLEYHPTQPELTRGG
jgi:hypothetical protein